MNKDIRLVVICMVATLIFFTVYTGVNIYIERKLSKTITNALVDYFENNNNHIAEYDFTINDAKIRCEGIDAYLVEFDLYLNDNKSTSFDRLGATIYKENDEWEVKGLGNGLINKDLDLYKFKCYY